MMRISNSNRFLAEGGAADVVIPLIRAAATIGFAIAPCSLGFVIIAVSEQLIRSIMVGEDPEMLVSDLQNQFPNDALAILGDDAGGLVTKVVEAIAHPAAGLEPLLDVCGVDFQSRVWAALQRTPIEVITPARIRPDLLQQIGEVAACSFVNDRRREYSR